MGEEVEKFIAGKIQQPQGAEPIFFDFANFNDRDAACRLFRRNKINTVSDDYEEELREYFAVQNPTFVYNPKFEEKFQECFCELKKNTPLVQQGRWVYFPWASTISHILEEEPFYLVRTNRNRNLITAEEQLKYYNSVIGIAGLSVGNSIVLAIVLQGGAKHLRIADLDRLALSNTNRIRAGVDSLGLLKTTMTARQIYAINPYAKVEVFSEGLIKDTMENFFSGPPKLDIMIDEIDNLGVKLFIRQRAKFHKIPVIMGADDGDNALIDIERYDKDPSTQFFHGRMGEVTYEQLSGLNKFEAGRMIAKYVGAENVPLRMQQSLKEMGKTIVSWPQLGGAALLNSSALAYCARKILIGEPLENNRALISLDENLIPDYASDFSKKQRAKEAEDFKKFLNL